MVTVTVTPSPTAMPDEDPLPAARPPVVVAPAAEPTVTRSGTLTVVSGNEGEGYCLALGTPAGLYTVASSTPAYDANVSTTSGSDGDEVVRAETGLHIHGRGSLGMAATYGQDVVLRGYLSSGTSTECSRYYDLGVTEILDVR